MRSPRRRTRELALQALYPGLLAGTLSSEAISQAADLRGFDEADGAFLGAMLKGITDSVEGLRAMIEPHAGRKWQDISPVEKAVLLIGTWELSSAAEVPYRVAINEALELAKRFGGTEGHRFVNGILDRVAAAVRPEEVAAAPARASRARPAPEVEA